MASERAKPPVAAAQAEAPTSAAASPRADSAVDGHDEPAKPTAYGTMSSMQVFRRHITRYASGNKVVIDAAGINSKACYDEWQAAACPMRRAGGRTS